MKTETFAMADPDSKKTVAVVVAMIGSVISSFKPANRYRVPHDPLFFSRAVVGERLRFREPTGPEREAAIRAMYAEARDEDRAIAEIGFEDFLRSIEGEAAS